MSTSKIGQDAFGQIRDPSEFGAKEGNMIMKGIINIGRQDAELDDLTTLQGGEVLGGSSDHLLVRREGSARVGNRMRFIPGYGSLLRAMTSKYVEKVYL